MVEKVNGGYLVILTFTIGFFITIWALLLTNVNVSFEIDDNTLEAIKSINISQGEEVNKYELKECIWNTEEQLYWCIDG